MTYLFIVYELLSNYNLLLCISYSRLIISLHASIIRTDDRCQEFVCPLLTSIDYTLCQVHFSVMKLQIEAQELSNEDK